MKIDLVPLVAVLQVFCLLGEPASASLIPSNARTQRNFTLFLCESPFDVETLALESLSGQRHMLSRVDQAILDAIHRLTPKHFHGAPVTYEDIADSAGIPVHTLKRRRKANSNVAMALAGLARAKFEDAWILGAVDKLAKDPARLPVSLTDVAVTAGVALTTLKRRRALNPVIYQAVASVTHANIQRPVDLMPPSKSDKKILAALPVAVRQFSRKIFYLDIARIAALCKKTVATRAVLNPTIKQAIDEANVGRKFVRSRSQTSASGGGLDSSRTESRFERRADSYGSPGVWAPNVVRRMTLTVDSDDKTWGKNPNVFEFRRRQSRAEETRTRFQSFLADQSTPPAPNEKAPVPPNSPDGLKIGGQYAWNWIEKALNLADWQTTRMQDHLGSEFLQTQTLFTVLDHFQMRLNLQSEALYRILWLEECTSRSNLKSLLLFSYPQGGVFGYLYMRRDEKAKVFDTLVSHHEQESQTVYLQVVTQALANYLTKGTMLRWFYSIPEDISSHARSLFESLRNDARLQVVIDGSDSIVATRRWSTDHGLVVLPKGSA